MPWVTPSSVSTGDVLTATRWNQDVVENTTVVYNSLRRLAYQTRTTDFNTTSNTVAGSSNVFASNASWTADGTSAYRIEVFIPSVQTNGSTGAAVFINLVNSAGTDLGRIGQSGEGDSAVHATAVTVNSVFYYTPPAGAAAVNIRAPHVVAGGVLRGGVAGAGNWAPMYIAVFGPVLT